MTFAFKSPEDAATARATLEKHLPGIAAAHRDAKPENDVAEMLREMIGQTAEQRKEAANKRYLETLLERVEAKR